MRHFPSLSRPERDAATGFLLENLGRRFELDRMSSSGKTVEHEIVMRDDLGSGQY